MAKKSNYPIPKPSLDHLKRLTDDTGIFQHAKFTIPLRSEGYTTDDNARALIAAAKYYSLYKEPEALKLLDKYLAFVLHAFNENGSVKNLMNFERSWPPAEAAHDAFGRMIWALGTLIADRPAEFYVQIAKERIDTAMSLIEKQYTRGIASSIIGLAGYLKKFPEADDAKSCMENGANLIISKFEKNMQPDWIWFEDILTYDISMLPYALFTAGVSLKEKRYIKFAEKICDFVISQTYRDDHYSFIGCNGWFPRGGTKAKYDQQPIEAMGTILMLDAAYKATKENRYLTMRQKAFNWFMGENDLGIALYDSNTKGCSDGLGAQGVSLNQGAESTISFLIGLLTICSNRLS